MPRDSQSRRTAGEGGGKRREGKTRILQKPSMEMEKVTLQDVFMVKSKYEWFLKNKTTRYSSYKKTIHRFLRIVTSKGVHTQK